MPIYEFYCAGCHRIFNFLARKPRTRKRPDCPRCGRPRLERRPSRFAVSTGRREAETGELPPGFDESRMEGAIERLSREAETIGDDDPRAMGRLMRRFYESSGVGMGAGMEEAIRRMESGEDPDSVEAELGPVLEKEDPLAGMSALRRRGKPPIVDDELYDL